MLHLVLALTFAVPPAQLAEARQLVDQFDYEKALKAVEAGLAQPDVDRDSLIALHELAGIAWGTLGKPARARQSFELLLSIAPEHQLSKNLPPRVRTPYFEARGNIARSGAVTLSAQPIARVDGQLGDLVLTARGNALVAPKAVRVTVKVKDRADVVQTLALDASLQVKVAVSAPSCQWSAELLGERQAVLTVLSGEEQPVASPVVTSAPPPPPPPPLRQPVDAPAANWQRPVAIAGGAVGVAALVAGGVFGYLSVDARTKIANAQKNEAGVVVGLTQAEAAGLDARARSTAMVADALFIGGGALAVASIVLFVASPAPQPVVVGVAPGGVFVAGRF